MYEMIVLALLMRGPKSGYLIAKIINDMIGPYARLSNGRLYPLLNKLEAAGLIAISERESMQRSRTYEITSTGETRFHELMMDTVSNPGDYQRIFWFKLPYLDYLEPAERLYLLDHYINYCQTHLFHVRNEMEDLVRKTRDHPGAYVDMSSAWLESTLRAMRHLERHWELERENALEWRTRELAAQEGRNTLPQPVEHEQHMQDSQRPTNSTKG